jgi:ribonucleoside-diphosphate reductase alpha subunit
MQVIKRNGTYENVHFDKIMRRVQTLVDMEPALKSANVALIAQRVITNLHNNITTSALDNLTAETAIFMETTHPDYGVLASRVEISNLHKNTNSDYAETARILFNHYNTETQTLTPLISADTYNNIMNNIEQIQSALVYTRDYSYSYFGYKTLEGAYLINIEGRPVERPQHMIMRVCIGIHGTDIVRAIKSYHYMSLKYFTHATPTLFNAGTNSQNLASCFLTQIAGDSLEGIYDTLKQNALISKSAGGIGMAISNIRANGSYIRGTNGTSNGIIPMLRIFNDSARFVKQGTKRRGSYAIYLEPHHAEILDFLELKKNNGVEDMRCRDLFYALWISDLFMKRVESKSKWSLFCPNECPNLNTTYGAEYEALYEKYELLGKARKTVDARDLWNRILISQIETGMPYMTYKDSVNSHNNQANLGVIQSSNLCAEITEYTAPDEVAVCNLVSICLPTYIENGAFNHAKLREVCGCIVENLNKVIDVSDYPISAAKYSNNRNRPIGIGIQGLADVFIMLGYPFDSADAKKLNQEIAETMYFSCAEASMELARNNNPYDTFIGSPASHGVLVPDSWNHKPTGRWNFAELRENIVKYGMRNSLLIALMPTASTSNIMGFNECFEPFTSNIYSRRVSSGEFIMINKYLVKDLIELNLWNTDIKNQIIADKGSVQNIAIPDKLKKIYRTVWELSMRDIIDMSYDRQVFTCQSQSLNLFVSVPNIAKLTSMHFYAYKKGLKTGMYYLRTNGAVEAIQFTIEKSKVVEECKMEEGCMMCSS